MTLGEIEIYRGDSYPIAIVVKDRSTGEPIDLTGYSFVMTCDSRKDPNDNSTQLFQVNGEVDPDQVNNTGKVTFTPTTSDTNQEIGKYYYDIQMTDASGHIRTIKKDKLKIVQDITK